MIQALIFFGVLLVVILVIVIYNKGKKAMIREAKARYDAALERGNKSQALDAGREYYKTLRGGTLSIYDEQAITNDLSTMK